MTDNVIDRKHLFVSLGSSTGNRAVNPAENFTRPLGGHAVSGGISL